MVSGEGLLYVHLPANLEEQSSIDCEDKSKRESGVLLTNSIVSTIYNCLWRSFSFVRNRHTWCHTMSDTQSHTVKYYMSQQSCTSQMSETVLEKKFVSVVRIIWLQCGGIHTYINFVQVSPCL